jgi:hypothetical protein
VRAQDARLIEGRRRRIEHRLDPSRQQGAREGRERRDRGPSPFVEERDNERRSTYEGQVLTYLAPYELGQFRLESFRFEAPPHVQYPSVGIALAPCAAILLNGIHRRTVAPAET